MLLRLLFTILVGTMGGLLFAAIHSPLPWLLGALIATVTCIFFKANLCIPACFRQAGLIVIGISLGLHMTPAIWQTMTGHIGLMLIATILTILISLLNAWIFHKVGKVDGVTALFSNIPGGLSEMVTIGHTVGGNQQIISIFHSLRAVLIVLCTPFIVNGLPHSSPSGLTTDGAYVLGIGQTVLVLAIGIIGALVASRCSIPAPYLLGALLLTAVFTINTSFSGENPALPGFLVKASQVFIGVSIGLGFRREDIKKHRRFFLFGLMHSVLLLVMVIGLAAGISFVAHTDLAASILATAPGGIAEMSLTALTTGADPLLVTAFQLFRVLFVLTLFSFGVRTWIQRHPGVAGAKRNKTA
jgi:membrane AbrB-like protein